MPSFQWASIVTGIALWLVVLYLLRQMAKGDPLTGVRLPVFWLIEKTLMFVPAESVTSRNFPEAAVSILPVMNRERSESGVDARAVSIPLLSIENA